MPAKSKSQQRLFGMVRAVQKGEMRAPSEKIRELARRMDTEDVREFAKTKRKGLPEKKKRRKKESAQLGNKLPNSVEAAIEKWANPTNGLTFQSLLSGMKSPSGRDGAAAILERLLQQQGVQLPPVPHLQTVDGKPSNAGNNPLGTRAGGFGIQNNVERRQNTL